jgi:hypothetical protein
MFSFEQQPCAIDYICSFISADLLILMARSRQVISRINQVFQVIKTKKRNISFVFI